MKAMANILSGLFHPLLMATYGMGLAFMSTYLVIYPLPLKLWILSGVFLMTAALHALFIYLMFQLKADADWSLDQRRRRTLPYLVYIGGSVASALFLYKMLMPFWISAMFLGVAIAMLLALCINFFWKISAHMIGLGGLLGGMMGVARMYFMNPYIGFMIVLLVGGLVGSARLILQKHTCGQLLAGYGLGFISIYISSLLSYFYFFI